jgi:hypothetical protein
MLVIIEADSGNGTTKRAWLRPGEWLVVGSTERADWVLAGDPQLAERHFSIGCDNTSCQLLATAETLLNGQPVREVQVRDNDVIVAGRFRFHIQIDGAPAGPSEQPAASTAADGGATVVVARDDSCLHRVGSWRFDCVPATWEPVAGMGLKWLSPGHEPGLVSVTESVLADFVDFTRYVQLLLSRLIQPALGLASVAPDAADICGAEEAVECSLRFSGPKGQSIVQRQVFARRGNRLGTAAFMTHEACVVQLASTFQQIRAGMSFQS